VIRKVPGDPALIAITPLQALCNPPATTLLNAHITPLHNPALIPLKLRFRIAFHPARTILTCITLYNTDFIPAADTSTAPLPMRYASMGYSSMGFTSMVYISIELLNFFILLNFYKEYMKMQVCIKEKCKYE
jgi:hypothetical protein